MAIKKLHYPNQSMVFIKKLRDAKIEVKENSLFINAEYIDFGNKKYQERKLKENKILNHGNKKS